VVHDEGWPGALGFNLGLDELVEKLLVIEGVYKVSVKVVLFAQLLS